MFIEASPTDVSSCSATLIGPDLILTAGHCVSSGMAVASGSFTLDYQTDAAQLTRRLRSEVRRRAA
jgi:V8-like Glu-specific endopeptidase